MLSTAQIETIGTKYRYVFTRRAYWSGVSGSEAYFIGSVGSLNAVLNQILMDDIRGDPVKVAVGLSVFSSLADSM